jgi:hypothetical protein|tara:strand:+ start:3753 stop:4610 length:858 start_codon:yes stop_codon:yes gene_type:complete
MVENTNPLNKYYRQPAIYISLPSKGKYYTAESYQATETGEIPVMPMTAKDEMAFKTPDAMINGQATVDVIKSCCPNILDPWQLTNYDLDTVLLGIRIATYGETMDMNATVPVVNEQIGHTVNLPALLESVKNIEIRDSFKTESGFEVFVKPLSYKQTTEAQVKTFEQQKIVAAVGQSSLTDEQKSQKFAEAHKALTDLNFQLLSTSFEKIITPDGQVVQDQNQIKEFLNNADTKTVNDLQNKMLEIRNQAQVKPIKLKSTDEQIKKGAPVSFEVPLTFDNSNFFV